MDTSDTKLAFHDQVTAILADLAADDEGPDDDLIEAMGNLTDILFESLNFKVTGEKTAEINLR
jgi:hypothetical protein